MVERTRRPVPGGWYAAGLLALLPACGAEDSTAFEADAPIVIDTVPLDGALDVDVELEQISATFSESMRTEGWSWVTEAGRPAPAITGLPFYIDDLTTVLPVRLEPS